MNEDRSNGTQGTSEPALTEQNSRTIRGEEILADDTTAVESNAEGSGARTRVGAGVSSYGSAGGTVDATEEGGDGTGI